MNESKTIAQILGELWSMRKWIAKVVLITTSVAMLIWLARPAVYRAETTLMPVENDQGMLDILGGLLDTPGLGRMVRQIGGSTASDRLKNFLKSRVLARQVIESLQIMPLVYPRKWDSQTGNWKNPNKPPSIQETIEWFGKDVLAVYDSEQGLIHVAVTWAGSEEMAARIANEIPIQLEQIINATSVSVARKNREFISIQLDKSKNDLTVKEESFRTFQETNKIYDFNTQAEAAIQTVAQLQAQLISKDVELGMLRRFATGDNPRVKLLQDEIFELRRQVKKMEQQNESADKFFPPLTDAPTLGLDYLRIKRELLIAEKVFELLTQQHELAKIEEARQRTLFQIIDRADVPEKVYSPVWWLHLFAGIILGLICAIVIIGFSPVIISFSNDVRQALKLEKKNKVQPEIEKKL